MTGETSKVRSDKKKPRHIIEIIEIIEIVEIFEIIEIMEIEIGNNAQNLKKWPLLLLLLLDIQ